MVFQKSNKYVVSFETSCVASLDEQAAVGTAGRPVSAERDGRARCNQGAAPAAPGRAGQLDVPCGAASSFSPQSYALRLHRFYRHELHVRFSDVTTWKV